MNMKDYIEKQKKIAGRLDSIFIGISVFTIGWALSRAFSQEDWAVFVPFIFILIMIPLGFAVRIKQWNVYHLEKITKGEEKS